MTTCASRRQARRFWGAMGAAMRVSSRRLDTRSQTRTDLVGGDNSLGDIQFDAYLAR